MIPGTTQAPTRGRHTVVDPPASSEFDDLTPGTVVGSWRIEHELGRGGMGTVYAVRHIAIGKAAALKVVHRDAMVGGYTARSVLTEACAVNAFSHPNVVDIFESGAMADGRPYLVMERLTGRTLGDRYHESRLPALEVIAYLVPLCDALAAAHAAGIIHRDVKLDNVFLALVHGPDVDGRPAVLVKLLDWGVATMIDSAGARGGEELAVGTPRYMAPEQVKGERATTAADIYALGVVAYELFCEKVPFAGPTTSCLLRAHVQEAPPMPHELWAEIPPALEQLLLAMLGKAPESRPRATEVAEVLLAVKDQLAPDSGAPPSARGGARSTRSVARAVVQIRRIDDAPTLNQEPTVRSHWSWPWPALAGLVAALLALASANPPAVDEDAAPPSFPW